MEEKKICCCGSSTGARVVGWFQFVVSFIGFIGLLSIIANASKFLAHPGIGRGPDGAQLTPEEIIARKNLLTTTIVASVLKLILVFLAVIMATILLRGLNNRNARLIQCWIVYQAIYLVIWVLISIVQISVQEPTKGVIVLVIVTWVLDLAIQGFCVWVVWTHKKEIEASARPVFELKA